MLTAEQHADLTARLTALLIAYAPASDKRQATAQLGEILAGVAIAPAAEDTPTTE